MNLTAQRETNETTITLDLDHDPDPDPPKVRVDWEAHGGLDEPLEPRMAQHLYETLLAYANLQGTLTATGDIAHHVIEDAAITLGTALHAHAQATPIQRFANATVPMDDALVTVNLDAGGRAYYESDLDATTPLIDHLLRSIAFNARATLHVRVLRGHDPHHIAEATMKALGHAIEAAYQPADKEASTKGTVSLRTREDAS